MGFEHTNSPRRLRFTRWTGGDRTTTPVGARKPHRTKCRRHNVAATYSSISTRFIRFDAQRFEGVAHVRMEEVHIRFFSPLLEMSRHDLFCYEKGRVFFSHSSGQPRGCRVDIVRLSE